METFTVTGLNIELTKSDLKPSGSSFFYAIQHAFKSFRTSNNAKQKQVIENIRQKISDMITLESWFEIDGGQVAFLKMTETIRYFLSQSHNKKQQCYQKCPSEKENPAILLQILFKIINPTMMERQIVPLWDLECSKLKSKQKSVSLKQLKEIWFTIFYQKIQFSIESLEQSLPNGTPVLTPEEKHDKISKLAYVSHYIFDHLTQKALHEFKAQLYDPNQWLPISLLYHLYTFHDINANILIVDYETKRLHEGMKSLYKKQDYKNDLPYIILVCMNEYHYECLGRTKTIAGRPTVHYLFTKNEPLILTLLSALEDNSVSYIPSTIL